MDLTLIASDSSIINIYDGNIFDLNVDDATTVNIYGGYVDTFLGNHSVPPSATINFYGFGFEYKAQGEWMPPMEPGEQGWWISKLTGDGLDGTPITYFGLPDPALNPNINLIPEPGTFGILGLGIVGGLFRRRPKSCWQNL